MEFKYCRNCASLKISEDAQWTLEYARELEALRKEEARMLDDGMNLIDARIHFKNRLWQMRESNVEMRSPQYVALERMVASIDAAVAADIYQKAGWHQKHSGEWVRKNKE